MFITLQSSVGLAPVPEMEKRLRGYWRNPSDLNPWHINKMYVKGRAYLPRAGW